jgi:hypothetical protein
LQKCISQYAAALLTSLVTILTVISDGINSISYETLYSVSNTRVRDTEVMVLAGTHTFSEALEGCRSHEMSIFVPRQNSDLNTLFAQFSITKTWIDVYYDERKERLNDHLIHLSFLHFYRIRHE